MIGAITGDIIGSPYEFGENKKTKDFQFFSRYSTYTDDSVMTIAVAEALLNSLNVNDDTIIKNNLIASLKKWGNNYPYAGYGSMFRQWLKSNNSQPYNSFGNGSAMRVSSAGWLYNTIEETRHIARLTAEITHNHPEGIKGAEATASAIFLARNGASKEVIYNYITNEFEYNLNRTCHEIRPSYQFNETCPGSVPEAIIAFLEGNSYKDVIRNAVSLGGDSDTIACIAGGIAEAYYGYPSDLTKECLQRITPDMTVVLVNFMIYRLRGEIK